MRDDDETNMLRPKRSAAFLPWVLFAALLGVTGWLAWSQHLPLVEESRKKDATMAEAQRAAADAKAKLAAAEAEAARAKDELAAARNDLAKSAARDAEDQKLIDQLKKEVGAGGGEVAGAGGQITVTMVDKILFKSGSADMTPKGEEVLRKVGAVLKGIDKLIEVSGHADNEPVQSEIKELYPTNWELSTARATNVVRFLEEQAGVKSRRLKAAGFGQTRPVASNGSAAGRAKNRRIEILLLPGKIKVVKGDFADEIAAAEPVKGKPRPTDQERLKAVMALKHPAPTPKKRR